MSLDVMVTGITEAIKAIIEYDIDRKVVGGATH